MTRTRIVRWLKVLLPLVALAMLSTLFLFSRKPGTEPQIPYAEVDAQSMARDPRIVAPEYAGVTEDGASLSLKASQVASGTQSVAEDLQLHWERPDGLTADVSAPAADVDERLIRLKGGVTMRTSSGWTVTTDQIDAATDKSRLEAPAEIQADAPFGRITAGRMELAPNATSGENDAAILNFSDGVRLIYQP